MLCMIEESKIKDTIQKAIDGAEIDIQNPRGDGLHFNAIVIAKQFEGKSLMEQQRMVMEPLSALFGSSLHALSLKTYTPDRWKKVNQ